MRKYTDKGKRGFVSTRKNKVFTHLMEKHNISLYTLSLRFELSEQMTLKLINDVMTLRMKHIVIMAGLFNIKASVLFQLLYCHYTAIPSHIEKEIEEDVLSLSKEIGLI